MTASCFCGSVAFEAIGTPIVINVCYCDDCQEGSRQIEALPDARPVCDPDGGTAYVLYRKDRVECVSGGPFKPDHRDLPNDVPSYRTFPVKFLAKLLAARVAMLVRR